MAAITASMVAELRGKTDAPMMECKKALTEADGDMAKAEELLRVKLGSKAGKAASRVTAEGVVASAIAGNTGAMIEVNCETDFVSNTDDFRQLIRNVLAEIDKAGAAANNDWLKDPNGPVQPMVAAAIGKLGENMPCRASSASAAPAMSASTSTWAASSA